MLRLTVLDLRNVRSSQQRLLKITVTVQAAVGRKIRNVDLTKNIQITNASQRLYFQFYNIKFLFIKEGPKKYSAHRKTNCIIFLGAIFKLTILTLSKNELLLSCLNSYSYVLGGWSGRS